MKSDYNPKEIESKWQKDWFEKGIYNAENKSSKPKYYALIEFPYPSGDGLHVGHPRPYIGLDLVARKRRMEGFNVLYPIGWDAFGLPTENFAIKTGKDPRVVTKENTDNFRKQIQSLGISFDWSREINTTDPKYYKWTQWLFLKFLEHDLAYKTKMTINWCPKDKIGLANEEVVDGKCERCGTPVEKREKEQWMLRITKYADRLDKDLDEVDYAEKIKLQQRNWIGKSEGTEIDFKIVSSKNQVVRVFTTRPDTIFGATYLVLAPEHPLIKNSELKIDNEEEVLEYVEEARNKTDIERGSVNREKTGVELKGLKAINPATQEEIPVWVADYVLPHYGTGAIMAVPADDERDKEFAEKFNLAIITAYKKAGFEDFGKKVTTYKLRDWVFSRQRYWGEPIPVIHCAKCGVVPVPEKDLPVELPVVENYLPTDTGESPLANIEAWVNTKCPLCSGEAKREIDTMPNWAGSSWYFLAYLFNKEGFENPVSFENWKSQIENLQYFMPVDWYNGGMEHTTLHLLYSRFWNKFLYDIGLVPTNEPYKKRTSHGLIIAEGGEKMSKSKGNVINPDDIVNRFGADTLRLYEMFMGPFDQSIAWSESALVGPRRFLEKVWRLAHKLCLENNTEQTQKDAENIPHESAYGSVSSAVPLMHQTIKKVTEDIEKMSFNTAISTMMVYVNELDKKEEVSLEEYKNLLLLLAPFAPHITEELWSNLGEGSSIHQSLWPSFDPAKLLEDKFTLVIQVDGKVRAKVDINRAESEDGIKNIALALPEISKWLEGKEVKKTIYVEGRLLNLLTS